VQTRFQWIAVVPAILFVLVLAALLLTSCGGGEDQQSSQEQYSETSASPVRPAEPSAEPTDRTMPERTVTEITTEETLPDTGGG
jgi:predicted small secreted protein